MSYVSCLVQKVVTSLIFVNLSGILARDNGGSDFIWEKDHEARAKLWKARHEFWYSAHASAPGKKVRNFNGYTSKAVMKVLAK